MLGTMERNERRFPRTPLLVAAIGGILALIVALPLGNATGIGDAATGHFVLVVWSAVPIAIVAGVASRSWLGVVSLLAGFGLAGVVAGVLDGMATGGDLLVGAVQAGMVVLLSMGFVGVPAYLVTVAFARMALTVRRHRTDTGASSDAATASASGAVVD